MKKEVMGTPPNPFKKGGPEAPGIHLTKRDGEESSEPIERNSKFAQSLKKLPDDLFTGVDTTRHDI